MPEVHGEGIYGIGAVSRMLGLEQATIRNWEERFELVCPERSAGGHRLFSRDDVERLRFLARRVEQGMTPAAAHRLLREQLLSGASLADEEPEEQPQLLVLLAERDPLAAQLTEFFLRTEGYEVSCVFTTSDALRRFEELRPALVIVDLLLSGGEGLGLCRELKRKGLPSLLALSTLATADAAGADAFLRKPVDPLRLVSTVKDLVGTSALTRSSRQPVHD